MRPRPRLFALIALAALLLLAAGCGPGGASSFTPETEDPTYQRGKELLRQGRNQEALASFLKVIGERGEQAPESHLEAGILYQQHIKDPIAAIYHYRKFRELRPNSNQADLVRQRIGAATREFARTLPAQPLDNQPDRGDMVEAIDRLQRENFELKQQLATARGAVLEASRGVASANLADAYAEAIVPMPAADGDDNALATRPAIESAPEPAPTPPPATAAGRRHVVVKGDTLYGIAKRYYGTGGPDRVQAILNANRGTLPNAAALQPGMSLVIP